MTQVAKIYPAMLLRYAAQPYPNQNAKLSQR